LISTTHKFGGKSKTYKATHGLLDGIVEGEKTGDGISYTSHFKNVNPRKARATTFYDPVHNARVDIKRLRTEGGRKAEEAIGVAS
jgi:hypothetical protein